MTAARFKILLPEPQWQSAKQAQATDIAVLTDIFQPNVNLSVWQRQLPPAVGQYAEHLLSVLKLPLQRRLALDEISSLLAQLLPEAAGKSDFIADIQQLSEMFSCLMDCPELGLRLKVLQQPMCPKFHTDHLLCRLVSTYIGPATEWHAGPLAQEAPCQTMQQGDVALLKGSGWEDMQTYAISHRSPVSPGERLLLTLDPVW